MKTFRHLLCLCLLLFPLAGKAQWQPVQEQEDNNTPEHAQLISNMSRVTGELGKTLGQERDAYDYYKIELSDDGKVEFAWSLPATQAHYWIELFEAKDGLGSQRGSKHISAEETQSAATHTFSCDGLAKGTYYVRLYMQQNFGGYTLDYKHVPSTFKNDAESNDKPEKAVLLNSGKQVSGRLGYSYHGYTDQHDHYKIVLEDDGKVEFAWSLPATQAHYWIELFEAKDGLGSQRGSKHISAEETKNAAIHTFSCDGLAKGTYYVQLYMQQKFGGYTLDYKHVPPSLANDPEPNDELAKAVLLNDEQTISGRLGYSYHGYTDQYDYYKVVLEDDGKVEFAWSLPATQAHYWIELFEAKDGLGSQRGSKHISAEETKNAAIHTFSCDGLAKGTYYVQLYMQQKFGGYTLNYKHVPPSLANDPEPNDELAKAVLLNDEQTISGRLGYSYHGYTDQYDYYKVVLEDDGKVEFAWSLPATQAHYWIELFEAKDGLGSQRGSKHISAEETKNAAIHTFSCDGLAKGTYYVQLYMQQKFGGYTLNYKHVPPSLANDPESNDKPETASVLNSGRQVTGRLGYSYHNYTDQYDYYKIVLEDDGKVEFAWSLPATQAHYWIELFEAKDGLGSQRGSKHISAEETQNAATHTFSCDGLAKGTYYVRLYMQQKFGGYKLYYQFKPNPFLVGNKVHNSYATRAKLNYGEAYSSAMGYTYHGVTTTTEEWYTLDTENVQTLSLQINRNKEIFLRATLYRVDGMNEDGTPALHDVLSNNLEGFTTALTYNIPEADRNKEYVLQVGHRRGSGEYTVTHGDRRIPKASPIRISYNGRSSLRKGVPGRYAVTISNESAKATEPFMLVVAHSKDVSLVGFNLPYMGGVEHLSINDVIHEGDSCASFIVPELAPWEKYTFEVVAEGTGDISYCPGMKDLQPKFAITGTTMLAVGAITFIGDVVADMVEDGVTEFITDKVNEKFAFNSAEAKAYAKVMGIHVNQLKEERQQEGKMMYATKAVVKTAATKFIEAFPGGKLITTAGAIAETTAAVATTLRHRLWFWIYKEIGLIDESELRVVDGKPIATAIVASWDPNEMVGPQGYGDEHYIGATRSIDYRILFENKAEAGAPAYRVRIFDELDANVFDVESVQFGSTSHDDPQYQWKMTREGNRLAWDIEGIELPPNVKAPEGEGFVSFSVRLKPNLPTGTVLANKATIIFDKNKPIETNLYKNTLDLQAPSVGRLTPDYVKGDSIIGLNFAANDELSGVGGYLLYVSKDGGEYKFFAQCQGQKVFFPIDKDKNETYKFYALAFDNVGNTNEEINPSNLVQTVTGIQRLHGDDSQVIAIYGSDGRRTTTLRPGVNILKMKNGITKKVIVR